MFLGESVKRFATALALCALLFGCNVELNVGEQPTQVITDPGPEKEREKSLKFAEYFLEKLDADEDTYLLTSESLKALTPKLVWDSVISGLRSAAGDFEEREVRGYGYTEAMDGAPPGHYFVIEYTSRFSSGVADEKVVVSFGDDGYEIAGYHLWKTWSAGKD